MCLHESWTVGHVLSNCMYLRTHSLCNGLEMSGRSVVVWEELCVYVDGHVGARPTCTCVCPVWLTCGCSCCQWEGPGISGGGTPGWGSGRREEVSAACTPFAHPAPQDTCSYGGKGWSKWVSGSLAQDLRWGPGSRRTLLPVLRHPAHRPLPPAPAWPVQPHKALFMAGGWPGAPEGGWGRRGGSCTRGQRTSGSVRGRPRHHHPALWGWTLGRSGLLPSPLPSCWPAPSPGPSFPATATAHPCHVKGGRRGAGSREGTSGWLGWGWGPWISKRRAEAPTR